MIKTAAHERQLVVATHSPLLLNDFELEDIFVFEKDKENATVVKRYYEDDFPQYEGELLPGQLWLDGEIGGFISSTLDKRGKSKKLVYGKLRHAPGIISCLDAQQLIAQDSELSRFVEIVKSMVDD